MGIRTTTVDTVDGVDCDRIHMTELCMYQSGRDTDADPMKMAVSIGYRKIGADGGGQIVRSKFSRTASIDDYLALATQHAGQGDMRLLDAITALEVAIAAVIEAAGVEGTCEVVA